MITIQNLTKRYGGFTAVDGISFEVRPGTVVGFLGPNGAGKSTTLRMIVGLTPATSGTSAVLGRDYRAIPNPGRHVGVMLDASAQHPGRTGREVMTLAALQMGLRKDAVDPMLTRIGLTRDESARTVRNYSLGMRQRLGLGVALLGDPQVLVLDEPANGLDPQGIHWMRGLLRGFADEGGTVLLSSHLLTEVQAVADEIVMIGGGRIVAHGSTAELTARRGTRVVSADDPVLAQRLREAGHEVESSAGGLLVNTDAAAVGRLALAAGIALSALSAEGGENLEEAYLRLTAPTNRENSHEGAAA